jgi:hypothetical protein
MWSTGFRYFSSASRERFHHLQWRFRTSKLFPDGIRKAAEESVQKLSSKIDRRALVCIVLHSFSFRFRSRLKTTPDRDLQECNAASLPFPWPILLRVIYEDWGGLLNSVEFGLLLMTANCRDPNVE